MNERTILFTFNHGGTLNANKVMYCELPMPWTLLGVKASASNDSSATITVSGGATIAEAVIGDTADPAYLQPTTPQPVDANELVTVTLDYNGNAGTAAQDVSIIVVGLVGD
jgi:hypothetical protein